jgi:hypothetical protein
VVGLEEGGAARWRDGVSKKFIYGLAQSQYV